MTDHTHRAQIARALRAAADAVERGETPHQIEWLSDTYDGRDDHNSAADAEAEAKRMCEPKDGEYDPDVGCVSWGVYVAVEYAHVDVVDTAESRTQCGERNVDEWWEVFLVDAWPDAPTTETER